MRKFIALLVSFKKDLRKRRGRRSLSDSIVCVSVCDRMWKRGKKIKKDFLLPWMILFIFQKKKGEDEK